MVKIGYKVLLAADVWTYTPRTLTGFTGKPRSELVGADECIYTRLNRKATAIKGFDDLIPVTPVSGSYGEKLKEMVIRYERIEAQGSVSIGAGVSTSIVIQPPAGEYWEISISTILQTGAPSARANPRLYDATLATYGGRAHSWYREDSTSDSGGQGHRLISNTQYIDIYGSNQDTVGRTLYYAYSGFKIKSSSIPKAKIIRLTEIKKPELHNPSVPTLPDYLSPLQKYAFYDFEGDEAILLEKDTPLAKDEKGNIIERLTAWVKLKSFERLFGDLIADTTKRPLMTYIRDRSVAKKMGWGKYVDKWKAEGIEF